MKTNLIQSARSAVTETPAGVMVAVATPSTGLATLFNLIPVVVGVTASIAGMILSVVLIRKHWKKGNIEIKILEAKLKKIETEK